MILVTGATGFVGGALVDRLVADAEFGDVIAAIRRSDRQWPSRVIPVQIGELSAITDWSAALRGVEKVVHCAARVHVMRDKTRNPLDAYRQVNVDGTLCFARQAAEAGVSRFVFVSSIKVNGESTESGHPFTADDCPAPLDPYGVSKLEAEQGLREISLRTGMEVVIVRPPLVYGPGVKANFASMLRWLARGVPLPLGAISNVRSMVSLDNLVDLLVTCLKHPAAAGEIFLVSDAEDVSTTELLRRTAIVMGKDAWLVPFPAKLLELGAAFVGKRDVALRLCSSLQVNIDKTCRTLGWQPPLTLDQGLKKAAEGMMS
jgi:UDP-glucose 4-epimerase